MSDLIKAMQAESETQHFENPKRDLGIKDLEETEGFANLTPQQQTMVKSSLTEYFNNPKHISNQNCHTAIEALEKERFEVDNPDYTIEDGKNPDFFRTTYKNLNEHSDNRIGFLKETVEKFGFPCVVHVSNMDWVNPDTIASIPDHSFLALGHNKNGDILCWDKKGRGSRYRILKIDDEYKDHEKYTYWGVRKLRQKSEII